MPQFPQIATRVAPGIVQSQSVGALHALQLPFEHVSLPSPHADVQRRVELVATIESASSQSSDERTPSPSMSEGASGPGTNASVGGTWASSITAGWPQPNATDARVITNASRVRRMRVFIVVGTSFEVPR
jgi:hypothetical protein